MDSRPLLEELDDKCGAYARRDVYGAMGRGRLPWVEKIRLGLALVTILPLRVLLGLVILATSYIVALICTAFLVPQGEGEGQEGYAHIKGRRRSVIVGAGRFLSRAMMFVLGFYRVSEFTKYGESEESEEERAGAIVSNHVSYIDILYHMSSSFPSFVAKRSVAELPIAGLISKCLGCVYVQRESKSSGDFKGISGVVNERVREAHRSKSAPKIMLFPEGTTTNGEYLLPFKTGAFLAKAPILPIIIRYPYRRFSPAWDSISGIRHAILLLCQFVNHIEVTKLPVYHPSEQEKEDPKLYAENVRRLMAREGNLLLSDIGLPEKRVYEAVLNGLL